MRASSFEVRDMANILSSWSTPIHQAAEEGRNDQLNLLLEYPDLDVNIQTKIYNDYEGIIVVHNTPLHLAAANGRLMYGPWMVEFSCLSLNLRREEMI